MQSLEARHKRFPGRSSVRSFAAGCRFTLAQSTLDLLAEVVDGNRSGDNEFLLNSVIHVGINNLPKDASEHIARTLGVGGADLLEDWGAAPDCQIHRPDGEPARGPDEIHMNALNRISLP